MRQKKGGHNIYFRTDEKKKIQGGGYWGSPFQDIQIVFCAIFLTPLPASAICLVVNVVVLSSDFNLSMFQLSSTSNLLTIRRCGLNIYYWQNYCKCSPLFVYLEWNGNCTRSCLLPPSSMDRNVFCNKIVLQSSLLYCSSKYTNCTIIKALYYQPL